MAPPGGELASAAADGGVVAAFLLGVFGGAHCLGMCGPLVATYAERMDGTDDGRGPGWPAIRQHLLFNLGRTVGYATVGALLGGIGALAFDAAAVVAVGNVVRAVAGVAVGAFVVAAGVRYLVGGGPTRAIPIPLPRLERLSGRVTRFLGSRLDDWAAGPGVVGLGAAHALLPCPVLYPAFLYALVTGAPLRGALALGAVGLGTIPTLFAYGTVVGSVAAGTRRRLHRGLGAAFVLLGLFPLYKGLSLLGVLPPMGH
jgi:hypothetical protein